MRKIADSELILNPDGSIYHLNLKPEHISDTIIFVGDQNRVPKVSKHFESIECDIQKREFRTITGTFKGKRITVISTGIGPDNIDIVVNELDALVNIVLSSWAQALRQGSIDEQRGPVRWFLSQPGAMVWWREFGTTQAEDLQAMVDSLIEQAESSTQRSTSADSA